MLSHLYTGFVILKYNAAIRECQETCASENARQRTRSELNLSKNFRKFMQDFSDAKAMLSESERKFLLQVARSSIESAVRSKPMPTFTTSEPSLLATGGAFVTLRERHELRGCIG